MALLSADAWVEISDFTGQNVLSHACHYLYRLLQKRHQKGPLTGDWLPLWVMWCGNQVRTADLSIYPCGNGLTSADLSRFAPLHICSLKLNMDYGNKIGDVGAQALAMLKASHTLHTLQLDLGGNNIGDAGARALASLKCSQKLHTLHLNLGRNKVTDAGAQVLGTLKDSNSLRTLHLNLDRNKVADAGAQALATLTDSKSLRTLHLNLARNKITDSGAQVWVSQALVMLKDAGNLCTLRLNLGQHRKEDDARALVTFKEGLHMLHLKLARKKKNSCRLHIISIRIS